MSNKLNPDKRLKLIERVVKEGASITQACLAFKVSRPIYYKWYLKYDPQASREENLARLSNKRKKLPKVKNRTSLRIENKIKLFLASAKPNLSKYDLYKEFRSSYPKVKIGLHGFYNSLVRLHLNTPERRLRYKKAVSSTRKWADGFSASEKLDAVERVISSGVSVSQVSQELDVTRATLHSWINRCRSVPRDRWLKSLERQKPICEYWHGQATEDQEQRVLDLVYEFPTVSKYGLADLMKERYEEIALGSHGIYNVLKRHDITTPEKRIAWVGTRDERMPSIRPELSWQDRVRLAWEQFLPSRAPAPPPAPLTTGLQRLKRLAPYLFLSLLLTISLYQYGNLLGQAKNTQQTIGYVFASIALSMGSVFFLYSLKYYFTLAIVLSFSREATAEGQAGGARRKISSGSWIKRIFGIELGSQAQSIGSKREEEAEEIVPAGGLDPSISETTLSRYPFISVHLPMYNEKRVAERLLRACTSFEYHSKDPNGDTPQATPATHARYEVIVVDDSTDETKEIVRNFTEEWNSQRSQSQPVIKLIQRETRQGFKGGALKQALARTDKRAEFITVFDADFVPYPDTLELFVKYLQATAGNLTEERLYKDSKIAAIQGYQWYVLNKSENWITRGVRTEYSGSYVVERSGEELYQGLKQIAGSVYMVRRDLLEAIGWGSSITEDFQLTLKLYEQGYKVVYTPYIQAPAECASTLKRLIRQRMRWAEGHSFNIKKSFTKLSTSPNLTLSEKLEFLYLSPYYLQAAFFLLGTAAWLLSETVFKTRLPFWTAIWGWSLVLTNILSLPLMNSIGLFLEEAEEKDFLGTLSFIILSYILVPFQAYASVKGFIEPDEGTWFRTPKTGKVTDVLRRGRLYRFLTTLFPGRVGVQAQKDAIASNINMGIENLALVRNSATLPIGGFSIKRRKARYIGKTLLSILILISTTLTSLAPAIPVAPNSEIQPAVGSGTILSPDTERDNSRPQSRLPKIIRQAYAQEEETSNEGMVSVSNSDIQLTSEKLNYQATEIPSFTVGEDRGWIETIIKTITDFIRNILGKEVTSLKDEIEVTIEDSQGREIKDIQVSQEEDGTLTVIPQANIQLTPGEYSLKISNKDTNQEKEEFLSPLPVKQEEDKEEQEQNILLEQDFTWGVLAINTNKSIYSTNEEAEIQIAVVDDEGVPVCDADIELTIKTPGGSIKQLTTSKGEEQGEIHVSRHCQEHDFTLVPDYITRYQVASERGTYEMTLTAKTSKGEYTIEDSFQVEEEDKIPFHIERREVTRLYPKATYPVVLNITANQDFKGTVTETVPISFTVLNPRRQTSTLLTQLSSNMKNIHKKLKKR